MAGRGISGPGVGMVTAGMFLIYVGIRKVTILEGLRSISQGTLPKPQNVPSTTAKTALDALYATGPTDPSAPAAAGAGGSGAGPLPQLVAAAQTFAGDQYSQSRRWQAGYSDCSSFVGKAFKAIGITPPGASITTSYLAWSALRRIDPSQVGAGDLICNTGHIIIATGPGTGIGQENGRLNVQTGSIDNLMGGQPYVCLRYVGTQPASASALAV